jgi:hypothetical protein
VERHLLHFPSLAQEATLLVCWHNTHTYYHATQTNPHMSYDFVPKVQANRSHGKCLAQGVAEI